MAKLIQLIFSISILLAAQSAPANSEKYLSLSKTTGLNENELRRIFLDWSDAFEDSEIYQISARFLPPKGPHQVIILYNFHSDNSGYRYTAQELTISLIGKDYQGELLDSVQVESRIRFFLDQSAQIELSPELTREDRSYLSDQSWKRKYVQYDNTLVPIELLGPRMYYVWSPARSVYIIRLRMGGSGESFHLRIERNENSEEVDLVHKTGLPII